LIGAEAFSPSKPPIIYFFLNLWPAKHLRKDLLCIQKPIYQVYSQLILAAIKGKGETKVK